MSEDRKARVSPERNHELQGVLAVHVGLGLGEVTTFNVAEVIALLQDHDEQARRLDIVGTECPVGDLSIVDSLRVEAQQHREHVAELEAAYRQAVIYETGPQTMRCSACDHYWEIGQAEDHEPNCLAIDTEGKAHAH